VGRRAEEGESEGLTLAKRGPARTSGEGKKRGEKSNQGGFSLLSSEAKISCREGKGLSEGGRERGKEASLTSWEKGSSLETAQQKETEEM